MNSYDRAFGRFIVVLVGSLLLAAVMVYTLKPAAADPTAVPVRPCPTSVAVVASPAAQTENGELYEALAWAREDPGHWLTIVGSLDGGQMLTGVRCDKIKGGACTLTLADEQYP